MQQNDDTTMQNNSKGIQFYGLGVLLQWVRRESLVYWSIRGEEHCLNDIPTHCNAALILVRLLQLRNCVCCHQITATPTHTHSQRHAGHSLYFHPPTAYDREAAGELIPASLYSPWGRVLFLCSQNAVGLMPRHSSQPFPVAVFHTPLFLKTKKTSVQLISLLIMKQGWNVNKKYSEKPNL